MDKFVNTSHLFNETVGVVLTPRKHRFKVQGGETMDIKLQLSHRMEGDCLKKSIHTLESVLLAKASLLHGHRILQQ